MPPTSSSCPRNRAAREPSCTRPATAIRSINDLIPIHTLPKNNLKKRINRKNKFYFLSRKFFSKCFISSSLKQCSISLKTLRICCPLVIFDK